MILWRHVVIYPQWIDDQNECVWIQKLVLNTLLQMDMIVSEILYVRLSIAV